jgi:DNA-directed RNA polymerase specialized sigma24 family protein
MELAYCPTPHSESWQQVWRLLVGHAWYRHQLDSRARWLLTIRGLSKDWLEDVKHDALLLLARNLHRAAHLHAAPHRLPDEFAPWMRGVITRDCQEAIRRIRRMTGYENYDSLEDRCEVALPSLEERLELQLLIGQLHPHWQGIVQLHLRGCTHHEIAGLLGTHSRYVRRTLRLAIREMQIAAHRTSQSRPTQAFRDSSEKSSPVIAPQYR